MMPRLYLLLVSRAVVALFAVWLAGCASSSSRGPSLYVLDEAAAPANVSASNAAPLLVVEPVALDAMLDDSGIVYQTAPHRVAIANDNRWASPLAGQLRALLVRELRTRLPGVRVLNGAPAGTPAMLTLTPRVDTFMGHFDGQARIEGTWQVRDASGGLRLARSFEQRVPLPRDGYDALVESLAAGWRDQVGRLAPSLASIMNASDEDTGRRQRD